MDPLLLLEASSLIILLASLIVNIHYIRGHYVHHSEHVATTTQTTNNLLLLDVHKKSTQNTPTTQLIAVDTCKPIRADTCVQTDKLYYVTLPEQLDQILEQLKINRPDLIHCMEWVGECEQATLTTTRAVNQQSQLIQNI